MKRWLIPVGVILAIVLAGVGWLAWSARAAYTSLTAARSQLATAQAAITSRNTATAQDAITEAAQSAQDARNQISQPIWALASAIPRLGDTPEAVRGVTTALDQALQGLQPAAAALASLDPASLIQQGGRLDLPALQSALPLLDGASAGVRQAQDTLSHTPKAVDGAMVIASVDQAQQQLTDQLGKLGGTLATITSVADLAPPLLGADRPQRYFVAMLNPNESRLGGGFLGTWAVIEADKGKLTVTEVGSNSALPNFDDLPIDLGAEFENRYGSDPALIGNSNLSPHFPNAAQLWLAAYQAKTGEKLDGVLAADVVALGDLLTATGGTAQMPDGTVMDGAQLTQFALTGVYEKFPDITQSAERKLYQEASARSALEAVTTANNPQAVVEALTEAASQRRVMLYTSNPAVEKELLSRPIGGSLAVAEGPNVMFGTINAGASKLDAWLKQEVTYEVGRCPDPAGQVRSQVTIELTNDVPEGTKIPPYMAGTQKVDEGPVNRVVAQLHLPAGAGITDVTLDGFPIEHTPFTEQGRPSLYVVLELLPRTPAEIQVFFTEPSSGKAANLTVQPLAQAPVAEIINRKC